MDDYPLRLVTRSYNGSEVQPSQTNGRQRYSVDVRQLLARHVKMLYVEHETYRGLSRFELVKVDVEPTEAVEVLDFVKVRQHANC